MSIQIDCAGDSHVGQKRPCNEDQFLIADLNKSMRIHQTSLALNHQTRLFGGSQGKLMLVADGLGGHESGERASTLAVDGVTNYVLNAMDWFFRLNDSNERDFESDLKQSFQHSQEILHLEAEAIPQRRGMATTLTMAYVDWPRVYVVHVGDTRCYHLRGKNIRQLTVDHNLRQLVESAGHPVDFDVGKTTGESSRLDHTLWNVVGGSDTKLTPDVSRTDLELGDTLLLCSDGLTRYLSEQEIAEVVDEDKPAEQVCKELVQAANDRGGNDNITVIVARFCEPENARTDCMQAEVEGSAGISAGQINLDDTQPLQTAN